MHLRDENLERYVLGRLSPSRSSSTELHIAKCEACKLRLQKAVESIAPPKERRREARSHIDAAATRQSLEPGSPVQELRVLDVSKGGIKMRVSERMEPGSPIQIRLKNTTASGEVRYCRSVGDSFHVGIQFTDISDTHH